MFEFIAKNDKATTDGKTTIAFGTRPPPRVCHTRTPVHGILLGPDGPIIGW